MSKPLKGFIAYSHKNSAEKDTLRTYLAVMKQQNKLVTWHDGDITGGDKARQEDILKEVADSDVLLYLVSAWSLASANCNKELAEALNADIRVIPIILERCDWLNHQLSDFQALPDKGKPINKWQPENDGWQNVVDGIRKAVEEMQTDVQKGTLPEWVFQQGNFLMMLGQLDRAIEAYSYAITLNPDNVDAYNNRGVAYNNIGEYDCAIENLDKAIELDPNCITAYNNRGNAYGEKGNYDRAIEDHTTAIELQPNLAIAYSNRGAAYRDKGDYDRAIENCNTAIKLQPDYADAYTNRGATYRSKGAYGEKDEIDRAIEDYSMAIGLNPNYVMAYNNRGAAYSDKGAYDRAIEDLDKAIDLKPDHTNAYFNRGNVYRKKDDFDRAIADYTKAIELNSNNARAHYYCGMAYVMKGEVGRAMDDLGKAIDLKPNYTEVYQYRGMMWLHLQKWEKAKSDLTTARDMGADIIASFHNTYESVPDFESTNEVKLPEYLAAILTPQGDATHESANDFEIILDEIVRKYDRAWKTLAKP